MDTEWNLQNHLREMEQRIRQDIRHVGVLAAKAQSDADENRFDIGQLTVRTKTLESNLKWAYSGIFTGVIALMGFVWNFLTKQSVQ